MDNLCLSLSLSLLFYLCSLTLSISLFHLSACTYTHRFSSSALRAFVWACVFFFFLGFATNECVFLVIGRRASHSALNHAPGDRALSNFCQICGIRQIGWNDESGMSVCFVDGLLKKHDCLSIQTLVNVDKNDTKMFHVGYLAF